MADSSNRSVNTTKARRVVIHRAGGYENLTFETFVPAALGPDDVEIEVRAIGVNYADCIVRMGLYASAKEFVGWPITPGFEVAGVVTKIGTSVSDLSVGDEVIGVTLFGGYTTHLTVPRHQVFRLPKGMSFEQGASFCAVYLTAHFALYYLAHPRAKDSVLIHSAAGGVGSCLVQLSKKNGCRVVGVVGSTHKVNVAKELGCDHVIDKSKEPLWPAAESISPKGYDSIFDANGVETLKESYNHLGLPGKLVVYGFATMIPKKGGKPDYVKLAVDYLRTPRFNPLDMTNLGRSVMAFNLSYLFHRRDFLTEAMGDLFGWYERGEIKCPPVSTYRFDRVVDAHRDIESGRTVGKLVLVPGLGQRFLCHGYKNKRRSTA